ncbi:MULTISPECIES: restriction endonuclease [Ramlibacter]|nr:MULTISPECIES: restriction endonuclease [Ramlibacter]
MAMKFPRMAPNSLFAVLLRSPWWISFAVAAAVVALTQALVPVPYRTLASLGAFPFVVIGCIALSRQWRQPSAAQSRARLEAAASMSWPEFEAALREGYARQGWQVQAARGAADLAIEKGGQRMLVSARRWKAARQGADVLEALDKAVREQEAQHGILVTLGELSPQAQRFATANGIDVLRQERLAALLPKS